MDFDDVIFGLRTGIKEELRNQYFFFDVIPPVAIATAYKKLNEAIRTIEAIHVDANK